jgi:hypothetical protein
MNLDDAHRLSLVQRNLEAAQIAIDSANELLRIVMEGGIGNQVRASEENIALPLRKEGSARKLPVKRQKKMPKELINEFLEHRSGDFVTADLFKWAKQKGYTFNKTSVQQQLYVMANQKKTLIALEKGKGHYQKAA